MSLRRTINRFAARRDHHLNLLDAAGRIPVKAGADATLAKHAITAVLAGNTSRPTRRRALQVRLDNAKKAERFGTLSDKQRVVRDFLKAQPDDLLSTSQREHLAKLSHRVLRLTTSGTASLEHYLATMEGKLRTAELARKLVAA